FFSSRRRHTRFSRDWSSDVCSSDLPPLLLLVRGPGDGGDLPVELAAGEGIEGEAHRLADLQPAAIRFECPGHDLDVAAANHLPGAAADHGRRTFVDAAPDPVVVEAVQDHAVAVGADLAAGGARLVVVAAQLELGNLEPGIRAPADDGFLRVHELAPLERRLATRVVEFALVLVVVQARDQSLRNVGIHL